MAVSQKQPALAFGQAVIGPPGSGKTTYCLGMQEFLSAIGRKVVVVNLDPANDGIPYPHISPKGAKPVGEDHVYCRPANLLLYRNTESKPMLWQLFFHLTLIIYLFIYLFNTFISRPSHPEGDSEQLTN
uniref:GPN-loop GTPase 2 n=1 Tax=Anolis carolinensis TaxID=28377 RepID=A0A803TAL4_ANOCA